MEIKTKKELRDLLTKYDYLKSLGSKRRKAIETIWDEQK